MIFFFQSFLLNLLNSIIKKKLINNFFLIKYNINEKIILNRFFFFDLFFLNFFKKNKNNFLLKIFQLKNKNVFKIKSFSQKNLFSFFIFFLKKISIWLISLILCILIFFFLSNVRLISFNKVLFEWFLIIMFLYWLLSGFTFFIKKYQFSKYTSVIQRFWRRSFILFWLIEGGVFLTFFYLTLNSSEEITYMSDQIKLFKTHFFSWKFFFLKISLNIILIFISFFLILSLNWSTFNKNNLFLLIITLILLYFVWLEFYQFFHIVNFYSNLIWVFDYDEYIWNLEIEFRRTRLSNNYVAVCLLAKFWHLIFIFVFWVFFILRVNEIKRLRYPLLSANNQNFIIMYIMSWLYMYPWLKFLFRGFLDINYSSFLNNSNKTSFRVFFYDLKLFYYSNFLNIFSKLFYFSNTDFYYFFKNSNFNVFSFKKHFLKDIFISYLN